MFLWLLACAGYFVLWKMFVALVGPNWTAASLFVVALLVVIVLVAPGE